MKEKLLNFIDKHFNFINIILYGSIVLDGFFIFTLIALAFFDVPIIIPSEVAVFYSINSIISLISMMLIYLHYGVLLLMTLCMIFASVILCLVIFFTEIAVVLLCLQQ